MNYWRLGLKQFTVHSYCHNILWYTKVSVIRKASVIVPEKLKHYLHALKNTKDTNKDTTLQCYKEKSEERVKYYSNA